MTYQDLKKNVLNGYAYNISTQRGKFMTGKKGVLDFLDICEKEGLYCEIAGSLIKVNNISLNNLKILNNDILL